VEERGASGTWVARGFLHSRCKLLEANHSPLATFFHSRMIEGCREKRAAVVPLCRVDAPSKRERTPFLQGHASRGLPQDDDSSGQIYFVWLKRIELARSTTVLMSKSREARTPRLSQLLLLGSPYLASRDAIHGKERQRREMTTASAADPTSPPEGSHAGLGALRQLRIIPHIARRCVLKRNEPAPTLRLGPRFDAGSSRSSGAETAAT
jgi:hypothetical protein